MNARTRALAARPVVALVGGLGALAMVASCSSDAATPAAAPSVVQSVTPPPPPPTSPFTGQTDIGESVLAVKLDNTTSALPHLGLTSADVVFVEQVEGGLTRLAVVYASSKPEVLAPIRSARETDAELLPMFGRIPVAFSGGVGAVHSMIKGAGLSDVSADVSGEGYYRISGRYAPYDLAGDPKLLAGRAKKVAPRSIGLTFDEDRPAGGKAASSVVARFPAASIGFTYKRSTNRWTYTLDGRTDQEPGRAAASASSVVVLYVPIGSANRPDSAGNPVPFTRSVGKGKALVLRDGRAYRVSWSRKSDDAPLRLTYRGSAFPLNPGQQWVVLANENSPATIG